MIYPVKKFAYFLKLRSLYKLTAKATTEQKVHKKHSETGPNKESQRQVIFLGNNLSSVSIRDESSLEQQERGETILLTPPQLPLSNDLGLKKNSWFVKAILAFVPDVVVVV